MCGYHGRGHDISRISCPPSSSPILATLSLAKRVESLTSSGGKLKDDMSALQKLIEEFVGALPPFPHSMRLQTESWLACIEALTGGRRASA